jgi:hypothetical protein
LAQKCRQHAASMWSESRENEAEFQRSKRKHAMAQALSNNHLVEGEITPALKRAQGIAMEREAKVRKLYDARRSQKREALRQPSRPSLHGLSVWLDPKLELPPQRELLNTLVKAKLSICDELNIHQAGVFITSDIEAPGKLAKWSAILGGGLICDMKYLLSHGAHGKSLKFKAAVHTKRYFWATDQFAAAQPHMYEALAFWTAQDTSLWIRSASQAAAIRAGERYSRLGQPSQMLIFVTEAEQASEEQ